jgi:hypothetical protein
MSQPLADASDNHRHDIPRLLLQLEKLEVFAPSK